MPKLIVMCGLPGSGKSTEAKKIARKEKAIILSSDAIRKEILGDESSQENGQKIFGILFYRIAKDLKQGQNVIVDCVNPKCCDRKRYLRKFEGLYDKSILIHMDTPIDKCKELNLLRDRVVPEWGIDKQAAKFEAPSDNDGYDELRVVHI